MDPKSSLVLKSKLTSLGKDAKLKLWSVPCKSKPVIFNLVMLPALSQVTPYHLHGLITLPVVLFVQEWRPEALWLTRVDFHFKRESTSSCNCFLLVTDEEEEYKQKHQQCKMRQKITPPLAKLQ